jgi:hypothetical protein
MNEDQARRTANVIIAAAAVGTAVLIVRSPSFRRFLWRLVRVYAAGPLTVYGASVVRDAWDTSVKRSLPSAGLRRTDRGHTAV